MIRRLLSTKRLCSCSVAIIATAAAFGPVQIQAANSSAAFVPAAADQLLGARADQHNFALVAANEPSTAGKSTDESSSPDILHEWPSCSPNCTQPQ